MRGYSQAKVRSSPPELLLRKDVLNIYRKFTGEHPCRSVISVKLYSNFMKIAPWHGCSPVNFLHIFRTHFPRNTSGWLLLKSLLSFLTDKSNLSEGLTSVFKLFAEQISLFYIIHWAYISAYGLRNKNIDQTKSDFKCKINFN